VSWIICLILENGVAPVSHIILEGQTPNLRLGAAHPVAWLEKQSTAKQRQSVSEIVGCNPCALECRVNGSSNLHRAVLETDGRTT
jgi:hypothetical protein